MELFIAQLASAPLEYFARAGGGGSGGGDGGGGIEFVLGYIPMHFIGALLAKARKVNLALSIVVQIIGWILALAYSIMWIMIFRGYGAFIAIAAMAGMGAGLYSWFSKLRQSKQVANQLAVSSQADAAWDEARLVEFASSVFMRYQYDWSTLNTESMKGYMTEYYHYHASLLVYILQTMGRQNLMENIVIKQATITSVFDSEDNTQDSFTIGFMASAQDKLVESQTGEVIFVDTNDFTEHWTFVRSGNNWLLSDIRQETEDVYSLNGAMMQFASSQGYHYSPDMGWLFIPRQGQLFGEAKFGTSDINNHVVGLYKGQMLVQIYTYNANPSGGSKNRVIAQVNVPRQYGNIIVRRKSRLNLFGIKNLQKIETEWTQFNDKYEVYASSYEGATSFELLNPTYMEQLEALGFTVTIEVVDNVIYLYTDERGSSVETYQTMLDLVNKAFNELRL